MREAVERHGGDGADLLMSHFVSAEEPGNPVNAPQIARFAEARAALAAPARRARQFLRDFPRGAACDWVRPGYALYGGNPTPGAPKSDAAPWRRSTSSSSRRAGSRRARAAATTANGRRAAAPGWRRCSPATPTGCRAAPARRRARGRRGRHRRPPLPAGRPRVDGPDDRRRHRVARDEVRPGVLARFFGPDAPLDEFAAARARSATTC